jgi:hypothetical protein
MEVDARHVRTTRTWNCRKLHVYFISHLSDFLSSPAARGYSSGSRCAVYFGKQRFRIPKFIDFRGIPRLCKTKALHQPFDPASPVAGMIKVAGSDIERKMIESGLSDLV